MSKRASLLLGGCQGPGYMGLPTPRQGGGLRADLPPEPPDRAAEFLKRKGAWQHLGS